MKILNNKIVKVEKIQKEIEVLPRESPRRYQTVEANKYTASICASGSSEFIYYKKLMDQALQENSLNPKDFNSEHILYASAFTYQLISEDWEFIGVCADMWMSIQLNSTESEDIMIIECDSMEHGLFAAFLIAKELRINNGF